MKTIKLIATLLAIVGCSKEPHTVPCVLCNKQTDIWKDMHETEYSPNNYALFMCRTCWRKSSIIQRACLYSQTLYLRDWPEDKGVLVLKAVLEGK